MSPLKKRLIEYSRNLTLRQFVMNTLLFMATLVIVGTCPPFTGKTAILILICLLYFAFEVTIISLKDNYGDLETEKVDEVRLENLKNRFRKNIDQWKRAKETTSPNNGTDIGKIPMGHIN